LYPTSAPPPLASVGAKSWWNGCWGCVVSAGWSHSMHGANCSACSVGTLPRAPDLFEERSSVASMHARYNPLWLFVMGVTEVPHVHRSSKDSCSTEGEYSLSNSQHTHRYAGKSRPTLQNSGKSVYCQWGAPLVGYNF
jgi:hypothetical protein